MRPFLLTLVTIDILCLVTNVMKDNSYFLGQIKKKLPEIINRT